MKSEGWSQPTERAAERSIEASRRTNRTIGWPTDQMLAAPLPLATFAPILISFSLRLVSDQTWIGSGVDSGHRFYFDKATDGVNRNENKPYAPAPATQPAIAA